MIKNVSVFHGFNEQFTKWYLKSGIKKEINKNRWTYPRNKRDVNLMTRLGKSCFLVIIRARFFESVFLIYLADVTLIH